eukprot:352475-Chlamydomonas_euryale.AAC.3
MCLPQRSMRHGPPLFSPTPCGHSSIQTQTTRPNPTANRRRYVTDAGQLQAAACCLHLLPAPPVCVVVVGLGGLVASTRHVWKWDAGLRGVHRAAWRCPPGLDAHVWIHTWRRPPCVDACACGNACGRWCGMPACSAVVGLGGMAASA